MTRLLQNLRFLLAHDVSCLPRLDLDECTVMRFLFKRTKHLFPKYYNNKFIKDHYVRNTV